jgi:hypothetical protein
MSMPLLDLVNELNRLVPASHNSVLPLRDPLIEAAIGRLVGSFISATKNEQDLARDAITRGSSLVLLGYAWDRAEFAVEHGSRQAIVDGLTAISLENARSDARDSVVRLAVLFRSAQRLGVDAGSWFAAAADATTNPWLKREIQDFPFRTQQQADLKAAFHIRESQIPEGFRYFQGPLPVRQAIWKEKLRRLWPW